MPRLYQEEEDGDDLEAKPEKAPAARPSAKERSVHLIPLLTALCFVILFLFSHDPSASGSCLCLIVCMVTFHLDS